MRCYHLFWVNTRDKNNIYNPPHTHTHKSMNANIKQMTLQKKKTDDGDMQVAQLMMFA